MWHMADDAHFLRQILSRRCVFCLPLSPSQRRLSKERKNPQRSYGMTTKIAINGFGRIGRQVTKALFQKYKGQFDLVAVNDLSDVKTNAHLFKYDSNYGIFPGSVEVDGGDIVVDGDRIKVLAERDPSKLPWAALGVEIVVESTGIFTDREKAGLHITAGAKKVIISAPAKGEDITICMGVN